MKIELDGNMLFDEETAEDICSLEELKGDLLRMVIVNLIEEKDNLNDQLLTQTIEIEKLQQEIDELHYYKDGGYSAY